MNTIAIIQARYASERFPGKMLEKLNGRTVIEEVFYRVHSVLPAIVAVPHGDEKRFATLGLPLWEASNDIGDNDVLKRFRECLDAIAPSAHCVVRVCGDNPLLHAYSLRVLVDAFEDVGPEYTGYRLPDGTPAIMRPTGYFAEAVRASSLRVIDDETPANHRWREHVTARFYEEEGHGIDWLPVPTWYFRRETLKFAAVDTVDDLERVRKYVKRRSEGSRKKGGERPH